MRGYIHFLDLVISHGKTKLRDTLLDGVPACQPRGKVNVARETKIAGVQNLICAGVVENSLGVNASLVGEGTEACDRVVERSVDLDGLGNEVLNLWLQTSDSNPGFCIKVLGLTVLTSLIMCSLYLPLTYSGSPTTMRAISPPRGVIPFLSPTVGGQLFGLCLEDSFC